MKTLSFYPRRPDGVSDAFCVADIADAAAESLFAQQMFATFDSALFIEVFEQDVLLRRYDRDPRPLSGEVQSTAGPVRRRSTAR